MIEDLPGVNPERLDFASAGVGANPRMGSANMTARSALFLPSDEAVFVSGAVITADIG